VSRRAWTAADYAAALETARAQVRDACRRLGEPDLAARVEVVFNGRFTARMGDAHLDRRRIRISAPLWPRASEDQRRQTVLHELCHLVAHARFGRGIPPHGAQWRALMEVLGEPPARCHQVDRSGLRRATARHLARCACGQHALSAVRAGRLARGTAAYRCRRCDGLLRLDAAAAEEGPARHSPGWRSS